MQFYDQFTLWRSLKKAPEHSEIRKVYNNWSDFYESMMIDSLNELKCKSIVDVISSLAGTKDKKNKQAMHGAKNTDIEYEWFKGGCPYYKLWPGVFDQFINTRMDIDRDMLRCPHKAFSIYMPKMDEPLLSFKIDGRIWFVSSIMVENFNPHRVLKNKLFKEFRTPIEQMLLEDKDMLSKSEKISNAIKVRIDFTTEDWDNLDLKEEQEQYRQFFKDVKIPTMYFQNIPFSDSEEMESIEDCIGEIKSSNWAEQDDSFKDAICPPSIIEACFRIVVGICFVSTGSQKVLEYDVISKHLNAYRKIKEEGNKKKCEEYEAKAKKRGKYGWNVGPERKDRHLVLPKGMTYDEALREAGSRELLYQHTRGGHWHLYWVGSKGNQKSIVKWVEETVVKPDLPIRLIKR